MNRLDPSRRRWAHVGLTLAVVALATTRASRAAEVTGPLAEMLGAFEVYAENARRQWAVPGMAIAIVEGDRIVSARGFGVKRLGSSDPVDADTVFQIGSTSKAFTAALVAMQVDDGTGHKASESWARFSGVEHPTTGMSGTVRLATPAIIEPWPISMNASAPAAASVSIDVRHRTGTVTCSADRSRHPSASGYEAPSWFDTTGAVGVWKVMSRSTSVRPSRALAMSGV